MSTKPSPYNVSKKNEQMMLDAILNKNSIFFDKVNSHGKVEIQVPRIVDAKSLKPLSTKVNPYAAQALKNMNIKSYRVITEAGAKALGTELKKDAVYFDLTASVKMNDSDRKAYQNRIDELQVSYAESVEANDVEKTNLINKEIASKTKALETGYKNISYRYSPAFQVKDQHALKNAYKEKNSPYLMSEEQRKKIDEELLPFSFVSKIPAERTDEEDLYIPAVIHGDEAKDWREHVKNCLSGSIVEISPEKAKEFSHAMVKDLSEGMEQGKPYVLQNAINKAAAELYKESKSIDITPDVEVTQNPEVENNVEEDSTEMVF